MTRAQTLVILQFLLFGILIVSAIVFETTSAGWLRVIGLVVVLTGVFIALFAIWQFQHIANGTPNISPQPNDTISLVQSGIYARIRHPIYTGVISAGLGMAIAHGHIIVIILALLFIPFFTIKSIYEEQLLRQHYEEYAVYISRSGRFLPFL